MWGSDTPRGPRREPTGPRDPRLLPRRPRLRAPAPHPVGEPVVSTPHDIYARAHVENWLKTERPYAEGKWPTEETDKLSPEEYETWVSQYIHRAVVLGVENPLGRQALGKALRTLQAIVESVVRQHGELPMGGYPSGEVVWAPRRVP